MCAALAAPAVASAVLALLVLIGPGTATAGASVADTATATATSTVTTTGADAAPLPVPEQSPAQSRAKAKDILDRPEYRRPQPGVFQRVSQWFGDLVGRVLQSLFTSGAGSVVGLVVLGVAVALVALLVVRLTRTVQHMPVRPEVAAPLDVQRTAPEWSRLAEEHERRGDWKAALRCRYGALVAELIARGLVGDLPGRTTGEYRADVARTLPEAADDFAVATDLFERAWYGDRPTGAEQSARFAERSASVLARAPHHRANRADDALVAPGAPR